MVRLFAVVMVVALLLPGATRAREQSPSPAPDLVTPDPRGCLVEPRSRGSLVTLLAADVPARSTSEPTGLIRFDPGAGEPADAQIVERVTATVVELYACSNAGDLRRMYALFTDDYLRRAFHSTPITDEFLARYDAAPKARATSERAAVAVGTVRVQEDGQVGAYVDVLSGGEPYTDLVTLVEEDGRYLVADVMPLAFRPAAADAPAP